jgi:[ribosomal protein S5]-alanine N-acetyltransferase
MTDIVTPRLHLKLMSPEFLEASLGDNIGVAESLLGVTIPADWYQVKPFMLWRLNNYKNDANYLPWGPRAIISTLQNHMIGSIGFHTAPNPEYLKEYISSGIEIGYTIFAAYRQQGYASEAVQGVMNWAEQKHAINTFVLSISPDNAPSQAIAKKFGFAKVGEHMDEEDGLEHVFVLALKK